MCGLAGIISTKETKFNINHFNILGSLNDERGGDSCGIFIDGNYSYGIDKTELFRTFTKDVKYPNRASIALLHCRKASLGYPVNITQAQPIIIKNNNKIDFVLMHNGTILNIQELSKKYLPKKSTLGMSDTQILAEIIYKFGYNVLEEYTGTAVIIMVDYRSDVPQVLIFKGNSCYNEKNTCCERPLYYMIDNNKFYFSSMFISLYCINHSNSIKSFPTNQLCKIQNNQIFKIKDINRDNLVKPVITYSYPTYNYNNQNTTTFYIWHNNDTGLYMDGLKEAHGKYNLYASGYIQPLGTANYHLYVKTYYFFYGRLLPNKEVFDLLSHISELYDEEVLSTWCVEIIDYFAYNPIIKDNTLKTIDSNFNYIPYLNGIYVNLFSNAHKIQVINGVVKKEAISPVNAEETFWDYVKSTYYNLDALEKQILKFITTKLVE